MIFTSEKGYTDDSLMTAVTVEGGMRAVKVPGPARQTGEALVRVERVGICGTDLAMFDGYTPFTGVIGHEFAGVVVEADSSGWLDQRVTASINIPGVSRSGFDWCTAKHDPQREALGIRGHDGAMAEYIAVPEVMLHRLPGNVDFAAGAMAEPLAAAMHAVDSLPENEGEVLVTGDGRLAQLIVRVLTSRAISTAALGKNEAKLNRIRETGARILFEDEIIEGEKFSRIIEASGGAEGIRTALEAVSPEGTVVLKSTLAHPVELDFFRVVVDEIRLVGSRCGSIGAALELLESGAVKVHDLISAVYPLARADEAFELMKKPDTIKVQLSPHGR